MKNYIIYVLLIAIGLMFIAFKFKGCKTDPPKPTITEAIEKAATAKDSEGLPTGEVAKKKIDLGTTESDTPGKETHKELIETESGKKFVKDTQKTKFGFYFQTKFYTGFDGNLTAGIGQEFFVYDRFSANALVGFPSIGLGIEGLITKNFGLFGGATWNYLDYQNISDFKTYKEGSFTAKPIVGIAFNF